MDEYRVMFSSDPVDVVFCLSCQGRRTSPWGLQIIVFSLPAEPSPAKLSRSRLRHYHRNANFITLTALDVHALDNVLYLRISYGEGEVTE